MGKPSIKKDVYDDYKAWLQSSPAPAPMPFYFPESKEFEFAKSECAEGIVRLYGKTAISDKADGSFEVNLVKAEESLFESGNAMGNEGYRLKGRHGGITIEAASDMGALYGVYAYLRRLGCAPTTDSLDFLDNFCEESAPAVPERVLNHWDNISGHTERGYSGGSLFFKNGDFCYDPARMKDYARLLASIGINRISINNVNVLDRSVNMITEDLLPEVAKLAEIFRPFGVKLIVSVDFESPRRIGKLETIDPLAEEASEWWRKQAEVVYKYVPDLAGFLVKADSEFRSGPEAVGRTQADGANVIARALAPHGGTVYWRCFVYNCMQDWRDTSIDRPKAAYEHFYPLDGSFDSNVILQIKNGPMDFQVREPNSPLLGAMKNTRQSIELQITQEYTGQQIDLYAWATQWEEIFSSNVTDTRTMRDLFGQEICATAAVSNTGADRNWTGHTLAQANLYAYGRMSWNPAITAREVLTEWVGQSFGTTPELAEPLLEMMMASRSVYEKYNAPLGIGWMVNIHHHYGPSVEGYEYMKWGTYLRANHRAIGVDRTRNGTGYTAQYHPSLEALYSNKETCPEELLLFFHRVEYDYVLKSGKTLLQHIYDTHFEGVEEVEGFIAQWDKLSNMLAEGIYTHVKAKLAAQLDNAKEWRDVVNTYFYRRCGIKDAKNRKIYE